MEKKQRMTIAELEVLLDREGECAIEILPNGEVRALGDTKIEAKHLKPITMREKLGGEYGIAA